jgi:hypothetical protein
MFHKGREFFDLMSDYQLPKKVYVRWSYGMDFYYTWHVYSFAIVIILI